jgi:hypothetical protein
MKRRLVALALAAALSATGTATLVTSQASAADAHPAAHSHSSTSHRPLFAGHAYLVTVDGGGAVYRNTFSADGTSITGLTVVGASPGRTFTAPAQAVQTGRKQFFISWVEPGGLTVSQVADFTKNTVEFWVTDEDGTGARTGQLYHATFKQVD